MKHVLVLGIVFSALQVVHTVPDFCMLPSDAGNGNEYKFFVFYDHETDQCKPFFYFGAGGNGNRFANERECLRNCSTNFESRYPMDASDACHFKKESGQCGGSFLRYYYDSVHDKCKKFLWTGCMGNGNRFFDQGSCNATCDGIHDDGDDPEEDEPDTPIAIIVGVLLAVVIFAVIITVVFLVVRSKKQKSKKSPRKSKEPQTDTPLQEMS
ncbi:BPTI/Kunitz domain-containing protein [Mugil cephalus]|uniref:BPTI/Kunitz domain-containing protein n=1 Tax=Mugil cephalus TaxID=48193 RepID=UPI001FB7A5D3|nr:BPTI/Kunitz domain-containing protein [Mugil cephalus]